jgi:hypothetical protein
MKLSLLTALNAERAARRAVIVVTDVERGEQRLVKSTDIAKDPLRAVLAEHLRSWSRSAPCISARRWRRSPNSSATT